jgi:60 kDa SS-A/Ro ribonucleoprotein
MANKTLFAQRNRIKLPFANVRNEASGTAYKFSSEHALAQLSVTGCFNGVFYAEACDMLKKVITLTNDVSPEFLARTAVYSRKYGYMKDMPALLCSVLAARDVGLLATVFDTVIDNGKMLRNFVQIVRSGTTGRKSLGTAPRRLVRNWIQKRSDEDLFKASVGNDPSFADIIKMVHPDPTVTKREALFGYLIGRPYNKELLPDVVTAFEDYKAGKTDTVPDIPFQFLTSLNLSEAAWKRIASHAPWQMTRMNLNTFLRHGVFNDKNLTSVIAERLRNRNEIRKAKVFPYQLMTAYRMCSGEIPIGIREALQDALEIAVENVPELNGKVYVCLDVSGSMRSPVTGCRKGATSTVQCIEVAALVAAAVLRKNIDAEVIPFSDDVIKTSLNPRDTVMTNAKILSSLPSGGTCCSAPLKWLNKRNAAGEMVIMLSDNQSWVETIGIPQKKHTATMEQWSKFKMRNRNAKMVCVDLQPYANSQAQERDDIMNIGGFSDQVFDIISLFSKGELSGEHWVNKINTVTL